MDEFRTMMLGERISRPKSPGLWLCITFQDGATLDAVYRLSLLDYDPTKGIEVHVLGVGTVGIPRAVMARIEVLGVVGARPSSRSETDGTRRSTLS